MKMVTLGANAVLQTYGFGLVTHNEIPAAILKKTNTLSLEPQLLMDLTKEDDYLRTQCERNSLVSLNRETILELNHIQYWLDGETIFISQLLA